MWLLSVGLCDFGLGHKGCCGATMLEVRTGRTRWQRLMTGRLCRMVRVQRRGVQGLSQITGRPWAPPKPQQGVGGVGGNADGSCSCSRLREDAVHLSLAGTGRRATLLGDCGVDTGWSGWNPVI
jgi:hypothetical protein